MAIRRPRIQARPNVNKVINSNRHKKLETITPEPPKIDVTEEVSPDNEVVDVPNISKSSQNEKNIEEIHEKNVQGTEELVKENTINSISDSLKINNSSNDNTFVIVDSEKNVGSIHEEKTICSDDSSFDKSLANLPRDISIFKESESSSNMVETSNVSLPVGVIEPEVCITENYDTVAEETSFIDTTYMGENVTNSFEQNDPILKDVTNNEDCDDIFLHPLSPSKISKNKSPMKIKKEASNRHRYYKGKEPPDKSKMTMLDLIYWNPSDNPMKSPPKSERPLANLTVSRRPSQSEESSNSFKSYDESSHSSAPAPKLKIGPNGEITIDEESLYIEQTLPQLSATVYEASPTTYASFREKKISRKWDKQDTIVFYRALSIVGTDFSIMERMLKKRWSRVDLKKKYKQEIRKNPDFVEKVSRMPGLADIELFEELWETEENSLKQEEFAKSLFMDEGINGFENSTPKLPPVIKKRKTPKSKTTVEENVIENILNKIEPKKRKRNKKLNSSNQEVTDNNSLTNDNSLISDVDKDASIGNNSQKKTRKYRKSKKIDESNITFPFDSENQLNSNITSVENDLPSKRRRGRKSKILTNDKNINNDSQLNNVTENIDKEIENNQPIKKKRGRKPKILSDESLMKVIELVLNATVNDICGIKKKRGRPKLLKTIQYDTSDSALPKQKGRKNKDLSIDDDSNSSNLNTPLERPKRACRKPLYLNEMECSDDSDSNILSGDEERTIKQNHKIQETNTSEEGEVIFAIDGTIQDVVLVSNEGDLIPCNSKSYSDEINAEIVSAVKNITTSIQDTGVTAVDDINVAVLQTFENTKESDTIVIKQNIHSSKINANTSENCEQNIKSMGLSSPKTIQSPRRKSKKQIPMTRNNIRKSKICDFTDEIPIVMDTPEIASYVTVETLKRKKKNENDSSIGRKIPKYSDFTVSESDILETDNEIVNSEPTLFNLNTVSLPPSETQSALIQPNIPVIDLQTPNAEVNESAINKQVCVEYPITLQECPEILLESCEIIQYPKNDENLSEFVELPVSSEIQNAPLLISVQNPSSNSYMTLQTISDASSSESKPSVSHLESQTKQCEADLQSIVFNEQYGAEINIISSKSQSETNLIMLESTEPGNSPKEDNDTILNVITDSNTSPHSVENVNTLNEISTILSEENSECANEDLLFTNTVNDLVKNNANDSIINNPSITSNINNIIIVKSQFCNKMDASEFRTIEDNNEMMNSPIKLNSSDRQYGNILSEIAVISPCTLSKNNETNIISQESNIKDIDAFKELISNNENDNSCKKINLLLHSDNKDTDSLNIADVKPEEYPHWIIDVPINKKEPLHCINNFQKKIDPASNVLKTSNLFENDKILDNVSIDENVVFKNEVNELEIKNILAHISESVSTNMITELQSSILRDKSLNATSKITGRRKFRPNINKVSDRSLKKTVSKKQTVNYLDCSKISIKDDNKNFFKNNCNIKQEEELSEVDQIICQDTEKTHSNFNELNNQYDLHTQVVSSESPSHLLSIVEEEDKNSITNISSMKKSDKILPSVGNNEVFMEVTENVHIENIQQNISTVITTDTCSIKKSSNGSNDPVLNIANTITNVQYLVNNVDEKLKDLPLQQNTTTSHNILKETDADIDKNTASTQSESNDQVISTDSTNVTSDINVEYDVNKCSSDNETQQRCDANESGHISNIITTNTEVISKENNSVNPGPKRFLRRKFQPNVSKVQRRSKNEKKLCTTSLQHCVTPVISKDVDNHNELTLNEIERNFEFIHGSERDISFETSNLNENLISNHSNLKINNNSNVLIDVSENILKSSEKAEFVSKTSITESEIKNIGENAIADLSTGIEHIVNEEISIELNQASPNTLIDTNSKSVDYSEMNELLEMKNSVCLDSNIQNRQITNDIIIQEDNDFNNVKIKPIMRKKKFIPHVSSVLQKNSNMDETSKSSNEKNQTSVSTKRRSGEEKEEDNIIDLNVQLQNFEELGIPLKFHQEGSPTLLHPATALCNVDVDNIFTYVKSIDSTPERCPRSIRENLLSKSNLISSIQDLQSLETSQLKFSENLILHPLPKDNIKIQISPKTHNTSDSNIQSLYFNSSRTSMSKLHKNPPQIIQENCYPQKQIIHVFTRTSNDDSSKMIVKNSNFHNISQTLPSDTVINSCDKCENVSIFKCNSRTPLPSGIQKLS